MRRKNGDEIRMIFHGAVDSYGDVINVLMARGGRYLAEGFAAGLEKLDPTWVVFYASSDGAIYFVAAMEGGFVSYPGEAISKRIEELPLPPELHEKVIAHIRLELATAVVADDVLPASVGKYSSSASVTNEPEFDLTPGREFGVILTASRFPRTPDERWQAQAGGFRVVARTPEGALRLLRQTVGGSEFGELGGWVD